MFKKYLVQTPRRGAFWRDSVWRRLRPWPRRRALRQRVGDPRLSIKAIAEVEVTALNGERETVKLAPCRPGRAGRSGDLHARDSQHRAPCRCRRPESITRFRSTCATSMIPPPVPAPTSPIRSTGAALSIAPRTCRSSPGTGRNARPRPADYTHIRWQLKHILKGKSVAFARFRAVVK